MVGGDRPVRVFVELSGENVPLAEAELEARLEGHGARVPAEDGRPLERMRAIELPSEEAARRLAGTLALFRQLLVPRPWPPVPGTVSPEAAPDTGVALRWLEAPPLDGARRLRECVETYRAAGGRLRLKGGGRELRLWLEGDAVHCFERIGEPDRAAFTGRRMPRLPYRQPVSLPPKRARVLANFAQIEAGTRVVDPFAGTGALLAEAALLGGRCVGIDRSDRMMRGAARNFEHLGVAAEAWLVGDAAGLASEFGPGSFGALLTDPPYGRASGSGGEDPAALLARTLAVWESRLAPGGRVALAVPQGSGHPLARPWRCTLAVPDRVHRSLVREFRAYRRDPALAESAPRTGRS
jgi:tRNA (guanine10-N2)-dimethyltransferase